jgi:uroporphyrinogen-III synthase
MANPVLKGLNILVTRPRDQAIQLAQDITQAGGVPLLFPLLEISAVHDTEVIQEQVSRLPQANLAIFISPNAVQYGMAAIRAGVGALPCPPKKAGGKSAESKRADGRQLPQSAGSAGHVLLPPALKIATVGLGSAKALRELGVTDVIVPDAQFDSEGLLAVPELQHVAGWRVMIFRGDGGRELLGDVLKARGAVVEYVTCYHRSKPQWDTCELFKANAITVTSSEALNHLSQMLEEPEQKRLFDTPLFVPHTRIAELAHRLGWLKVHLTGAGDAGLLSGLMEWAKNRIQASEARSGDRGLRIAANCSSAKGNE